MSQRTKGPGDEVGKLTPMKLLALKEREGYRFFYRITTPLLKLNLILLGGHSAVAMFLLPEVRRSFIERVVMIVVLVAVFEFWVKSAIKYCWETARELSAWDKALESYKVRFYRLAIKCYWRSFICFSRVWSYLTLGMALVSAASEGMIVYLMLSRFDNIVWLVQRTWTVSTWSIMVQSGYCLLMRRTINAMKK